MGLADCVQDARSAAPNDWESTRPVIDSTPDFGHVTSSFMPLANLARGAPPLLRRVPILLRTMSSTSAYVLPVDPKSQSGASALPGVDSAKLWSTTPADAKPANVGTTRVFYNTPAEQGKTHVSALVSLGDKFDSKKGGARRELVRKAVGSGVKHVKGLGEGEKKIVVDASLDPHAAGELDIVLRNVNLLNHLPTTLSAVAAHLAKYNFTLKTSPASPFRPDSKDAVPEKLAFEPLNGSEEWVIGTIYANAQNFARTVGNNYRIVA